MIAAVFRRLSYKAAASLFLNLTRIWHVRDCPVFSFRSKMQPPLLACRLQMPDLAYLRKEIEHMRRQVLRQRSEIKQLQRAGIPTESAEELLERMQTKVDGLCTERDRQVKEQKLKYPGTDKVINGPIERRFR